MEIIFRLLLFPPLLVFPPPIEKLISSKISSRRAYVVDHVRVAHKTPKALFGTRAMTTLLYSQTRNIHQTYGFDACYLITVVVHCGITVKYYRFSPYAQVIIIRRSSSIFNLLRSEEADNRHSLRFLDCTERHLMRARNNLSRIEENRCHELDLIDN